MKIQYASDLHLEFGINSAFIMHDQPINPIGDILILAGDIGYLEDKRFENHPFFDWVSDNFNETILIPGNHEFYGGFDINNLTDNWEYHLRSNVRYVYNQMIHLNNDIDLIFSTLWSKISSSYANLCQRNVNDFHRIKDGDKLLSWMRFNEEHKKCLNFIKSSLNKSNAHNILVVSHHVPSFTLMSDEFAKSPLNESFASEIIDLVSVKKVKYWIYGHSHRNISRKIGYTQFISNQYGYVNAYEHLTFRSDALIEL